STEVNPADLQIKFAVVMYGGGSLAIYINGVAQELLKLVQATESNAPNLATTTRIYRKIAFLLADENKQRELAELEEAIVSLKDDIAGANEGENKRMLQRTLEENLRKLKDFDDSLKRQAESFVKPRVRFVIDVLTGSSAGGINAVYLSKALVNGVDNIEQLRKLWIEQGDFAKLLNDKKSVLDNQLQPPIEPVSLLNSQRMYLELLRALDGMEDQANIGNRLVEQLDLYVTYTDFKGLPLPMPLADKTVLERRHKQVFNFRYNGSININDFTKENNPFLAFAARSTSAFPLAFEPSRLTDIDEVIDSSLPQYAMGKSDNEAWGKYFRELTDENGEKVIWKNRSFVDGGALDNKPFGYAIDKLVQRPSEGIVRRKLLYIEPSPEEFMPEKDKFEKPDAIQNLLGQGVNLPRYETIREDLLRVLSRNHLIRRVKRLTSDVERDFENHSEMLQPLPENLDWSDIGLNEIVRYKGMAFLLYYRLRVSSVTDEIARLATSYFRIDPESDYFKILRCLIRIWRDEDYRENKEKAQDKTLNQFLYLYDVDYRFRRLQFIMQKAENLLRCKDEIFKQLTEISFTDSGENIKRERAVENARKAETGVVSTTAALQKALPDSNRKEFVEYLKKNRDKFVEEVKNVQSQVNKIYLQLRRENEFLLTGLNNPKLAKGLLKEKEYEEYNPRLENFIDGLRGVEEQLRQLEADKQGLGVKIESLKEAEQKNLSLAAFNRITGEMKRSFSGDGINGNKNCGDNNEIDCIVSLKDAYGEEALYGISKNLKAAADSLSEFYNTEGSFLRAAAADMKELLGIEEKKNGDSTALAEKAEEPFQPENYIGKFIREYLKNYYLLFDSYDQISFPIFFETPVGEAVEVDVIRISSRDADSLINEEDKNEERRKLAGNTLFNFGAFLDRKWRLNDIMWGRLDGAERLIETLLPGEGYAAYREILIQEANLIILNEMLLSVNSDEFQGIVVNALTLAGTEAITKKAVDKLVLGLTANKIQTGINTALISSLEEENICDEIKARYEVNRQLEPKPTLQMVSRATQVIGKVFERIAEKQAQAGNRVSWIARLGQIFLGLTTVAVPNSFANLLFVYWLYVIYMFEVFLIIGGLIFNSSE
ncbi:MAG TPA: patatin-like protein, partial [Pyrinomonadaceae bacterium]|nr:patatin-like protein [Pyrinomonadaceae bacterium]